MMRTRPALGLCLALCAALLGAPRVAAQPAAPTGEPSGSISTQDEPYQSLRAIRSQPDQNRYLGTVDCERCHTQPTTRDLARGVTDRVCLTEWKTWRNADRHSESYQNLTGERGQRMGKLLGADVLDPATGCVQCHTSTLDATRWDTACFFEGENTCVPEGVGCEACHGPSSSWVAGHREFPNWRNVVPDEKTRLGWVDLRSPVARAEVCISCHVGSPAHHRMITHDMYAAGHPPLAGFEIETFADKLPRHWRYPYEKAGSTEASFPRTQKLLTASVVSVRMAVELALANATAADPGTGWPELARFDCFSCHHKLEDPRWEQIRQSRTAPGRLRLTVGCLPLVEVAVATVNGPAAADEVDRLVWQLDEPFAAYVFGDPKKLKENGAAIIDWCRSIDTQLASANLSAEQASEVLRAIAHQATTRYYDYDTSRQLFGAWTVVYGELLANRALELSEDAQRRMDSILEQIEGHDPFLLERERPGDTCARPPGKRLVEALLPTLFGNRKKFYPSDFVVMMERLNELTSQ